MSFHGMRKTGDIRNNADGCSSNPLPPLGFLDLEKIKQENSRYSQHPPATVNMPAPPLASPSTIYSGPPPPYSYPSSAASSTVGTNNASLRGPTPATYRPSHIRQDSKDDKDPSYPVQRQSLPSINEALSINSMLTTTAPARNATTARSPTSPTTRYDSYTSRAPIESYRPQSPPDSRPYEDLQRTATATAPYSPRPIGSYDSQPSAAVNPPINSYPSSQPPRTVPSPAPHQRSGASALQQRPSYSSYNRQPFPSPSRPDQSPQSGYAYQQYQQPAYSYPPSTPGVPSYPTSAYEPWRSSANLDLERAEEVRKAVPKQSPPGSRPAYGESVKRHLDIFDLETSLNEIAEGSGRTLEWSRHYRIQAHSTQRSGPIDGSLPDLNDCDDMIRQQHKVLDSMTRIRSVIFNQQQALAEKSRYDPQHFKSTTSEPDDEPSFMDKMDGAGGFAGPDSKKRRGRAAPPGRCHSCNRAETPEWRRGPDGARTLCNACGLHYAKLTRKMGKGSSAVGSSNLRPKDMDPTSP